MKTTLRYATSTIIAGATGLSLLAGPLARPAAADDVGSTILNAIGGKGGGHQGEKNAMRNLGIGLGAAAAYEAITGKGTNALILGAGAAYAGKKYEDARKAQSQENAWRDDRRFNDEYRRGDYRNPQRYDDRHHDNQHSYRPDRDHDRD
jgi:hypothetical protein